MKLSDKEMDERINKLIEVLGIRFRENSYWREPKAETEWGEKTRIGLIKTIKRIMYDEEEG